MGRDKILMRGDVSKFWLMWGYPPSPSSREDPKKSNSVYSRPYKHFYF